MPPSSQRPRIDHLVEFLQRIARPIEFASRDSYAHLSTVTNLETFVSGQVISALAARTYSRHVESELLSLRNLFVGFHTGLTPKEQRTRLAEALTLLRRLTSTRGQSDPEKPRAGPMAKPASSTQSGTAQPLWDLPIQFIKGVGPKRTLLLERMGVRTVEDVLWSLPWRYEDRSTVTSIGKLSPGMTATVCGVVTDCTAKRSRVRRMSVLDLVVEDGTGRLQAVFFNQPYLEDVLKSGTRIMMTGRIMTGNRGWLTLRIEPMQVEVIGEDSETPLHVGRIVPIYHETKGWTSRQMRVLVRSLLDQHRADLAEVLPIHIRARYRFPPILRAVEEVHFPPSDADPAALERGVTPAHRRLAFEELLLLQVAMALRQRRVKEETKTARFNPHTPLLHRLAAILPFKLTGAQERVFREIQADMVASTPMNRLLQGDVGSGKTVVALHAMVMACGSGCQAAFMVPTEILAEQHFLNLRPSFEALGLKCVLLTGGGRSKARTDALRQLQSGTAHVAIGTHALIQKDVRFADLGFAVVDEQHKFGVLQRKNLIDKGYRPDVLIMTATPIPRTLAMTVYGDLDVSIIDALPPGRKPVRTWVFSEFQRGRAWRILQDELRARRQAYIVYPLVEESEKIDLQAAIQAAERLQREEFPEFRIGLIHGRMSSAEKDRTMTAYKAGDIHILVATTVVEVGVDVPNASVMIIEHAERFGLAQLHQLRGRVGRSSHQSYCLLMTTNSTRRNQPGIGLASTEGKAVSLAQQRLEAMVKSNDGFLMAEEDLRIRGPGEFFGLRQWGIPEFRAANLVRDVDLIETARREAFGLLEQDPFLNAPQHQALKAAMLRRWQARLHLGSVS